MEKLKEIFYEETGKQEYAHIEAESKYSTFKILIWSVLFVLVSEVCGGWRLTSIITCFEIW